MTATRLSVEHAHTVIIGAGHAGVECAWALRAAEVSGTILLFSAESHLPYERPPLSKGLLSGKTDAARMALRADAAYEKANIVRVTNDPVVTLDTASRTVHTQSGRSVTYDHCVLATGAVARALPGLSGPDVLSVRTLDDAHALRESLTPGTRLLVVGGGYLGLEAACTAIGLGASVRVLEQSASVMPGKVSSHTADRIARLHIDAGVDMVHGARVARWIKESQGWRVELQDGRTFEADVVLVAIGAQADTALARAAGLMCEDGIVIDEACRTSAPGVYAIGDCASAMRAEVGRRMRIESVNNALCTARAAAAHIGERAMPPLRAPTFWSEQHGRRLQMAGLVDPGLPCNDDYQETSKGWLVKRYQNGKLAAIEAVDSPVEFVKTVTQIGQPPAH